MPAAEAFFDSNVVLYLLSADQAKADRAEELIASGGTTSIQVLNEVAAVCRRKVGMSWREVRDILIQVRRACRVVPLTIETHERGLAIAERMQVSIYDGMIVASALLAGCKVLYTEDLQDGRTVDRQLTIRDPFV